MCLGKMMSKMTCGYTEGLLLVKKYVDLHYDLEYVILSILNSQ